MRSAPLLTSAVLYTSLAAAWSWHGQVDSVGIMDIGGVFKRQNDDSAASSSNTFAEVTLGNTAAATPNPTDSFSSTTTDASSESSGSSTSGSKSTGSSGSSAKTTEKSGSAKASTGTKTTTKSASISINPVDPAGGVSMITPNVMSAASYYKIGDWVTFAWNYTSVSVTPTAVDILASCSLNDATYTIALNQSITAATQEVLWDTAAYQANNALLLLTETYTLLIYDSKSSVSATPEAGYLAPQATFTFGMYSPQAATPLADYVCATCNGAGTLERQTMEFLLGMVGLTVLSFTWFAGAAGVF